MPKVLVAWLGRTDLKAPEESAQTGLGPIANALEARPFDHAYLLSDYDPALVAPYLKWLRQRVKTPVEVIPEKLTGPTNFGEIYEAACRGILRIQQEHSKSVGLTFHLSPGTPAMGAVWIILGKTRFPAELIESSKDHGVRTASVPFDITADFIPDLLRERDEHLKAASAAQPPEAPEFADILHRSRVMSRLIDQARRVAIHNVPVLIEGESGTGKELLSRAIHKASPRRDRPFIPVNCGAIPAELIEGELFGHEKGAFTGATQKREGYFEAADKGTLFLDEIGELPAAAQVKLLRVIQEGEVVRLGATTPIKVDVRIIGATNRTLTEEISVGRFREDLFYRLAVAVLKIPPLRERAGDLGLLIDRLLGLVNSESSSVTHYKDKKLSASAKNLLLAHPWPGNVRELLNTLRRVAIWSEGTTISPEDVREALLPATKPHRSDVLGRPLGGGFKLPELLRDVAASYLERAMDEAHGKKVDAAKLVGLPSHQTLSNWLDKYGVQR